MCVSKGALIADVRTRYKLWMYCVHLGTPVLCRTKAFIREHLGEGIQAPVVVNTPDYGACCALMLFHDHLSLSQITDHNGSLNQFVAMR